LSTIKSVNSGAAIAASFAENAAGVELVLGDAKIGKSSKLEFFVDNWKTLGPETGGLAGLHLLEIKAPLPTKEPGADG
jgi:hypothetical protein